MDHEGFSTELILRIDWSELDLFGHVNNVMYFKYLQAARVNYWDLIGLSDSFLKHKMGAMLLSTNCHFKKPLFYPGEVRIKTQLEFIKNTSFGLVHRVFNQQNQEAATGNDVVVFYNYNQHIKESIPEWLRDNLKKS